ncbi:MAG: hypothetical protein KDC24_05630 [Saprospiraceae bacterium]|nr:hypothetical protein [Saprospiraceae bacterium]
MSLRLGPILSLFICLFCLFNVQGQDRVYQGYRLHLSGLKVIEKNTQGATIAFTAVNTGKHAIDTEQKEQLELLVLNFDPSLLQLEYVQDDKPLLDAFFKRTFLLEPGAYIQINDLKLEAPVKEMTAPTFKVPKPAKKDSSKVEPNKELPNNENQSQDTLLTTEKEKTSEAKEEKDIILVAPEIDRRPIEELLEEKNSCPDLVFDTLKVIKKTDRTAWVEFTIKNIGKGPAQLYNKGTEERPFGIRAFISGSTFISKGSVTIGGHTIDKGLGETIGILHPGEVYKETVQFDIRKMTRYMPVLILSLDAFLKLRECDRTNNTSHIIFE